MNILYLDFDGVLHHENCLYHPRRGAYLEAPERYTLFQHAELLVQLLAPYPALQIVLSTSWVLRYGCSATAKRLPPGLRDRVVGATFHSRHMHADDFRVLPRGVQVAEDALRRQPRAWIALDDDDEGWLKEHRHRLIKTHQYEGLNMPGVIQKLNAKLAEMHK
ncbi:HAD domain-containing protein [Rhodoferax sp.]|uniref:HAD domain-containing protein n=1 Tax=Rhodoferax sp. TaxID=50421 RepID=UPI0028519D57|nr:HAD domain-containing protein [Rhodoferax sp.]MDR3369072.1 HAD domain-containing protein [Rhodoferax sp.]